MAVPVKFAVELLNKAGWKTPENAQQEATQQLGANTNVNATSSTQSRPQ
jgi:hypothetical protein